MESSDRYFRPSYHFTPPANWLNDPNGLVYYQGEYHLFYQFHPDSGHWGPMHWGHAVSRDLIHWEHLPLAIEADELGYIFSGSAVIDWNNTAGFGKEAMVAFFTYDRSGVESQAIAYSTDRGRTWTKYAGNPVIPARRCRPDFRDPKVIWYDEGSGEGHWVMVLAAGDDILFYTSADLKNWKRSGTFGGEHGSCEFVWETPDLFELPVDNGPEKRWVLTLGVSHGGPAGRSAGQYFVGLFDGETFISENPKSTVLWADYGADYYAAQAWNDAPGGRRIMIGWMNSWHYAVSAPTTTWHGAMSLPREVCLITTPGGIRMASRPVVEVTALRGNSFYWQDETISEGMTPWAIGGDCLEITAGFEFTSAVSSFGLRVRSGSDCFTDIGYDVRKQTVFVDRTNAGVSSFFDGFAARHEAHLVLQENRVHLHLFVDKSSVELFVDNGVVSLADTIYPSEGSSGMALFAHGGSVELRSLEIHTINPARFTALDEVLPAYQKSLVEEK